jgi:aspartate beta-hydroxylase
MVPRNAAKYPLLASLVVSSPDVLRAALSYLAPAKHIPLHRSPFRGVIRFYLGLDVPQADDDLPAVILAIDEVEYRIGTGAALLWDDTHPHEVWNRSNQWRITLLLDVRRRGMPPDMVLLSRLLVSAAGFGIRLRGDLRQQALAWAVSEPAFFSRGSLSAIRL